MSESIETQNVELPPAREFELLPSQKKHISFSELTTWIKCSYRYWLIYILNKNKEEPSFYADFGTAVHSAVEYYLRTRSKASIIFAIEYIKLCWDSNPQYEQSLPIKIAIKQAQLLIDELPIWLEKNFPNWEYVAAEELLYEDIGLEKHPHAFKGYIDAVIKYVDKSGKEKYWMLDAKTSTSGWRSEKRQDQSVHRQLVLYKHFWTNKYKLNLRQVGAAFLILKRSGKENASRIDLIPLSIGPKTVQRHLDVLNKSLTGIKSGIKMKNRYECDWCEFANTEHCSGFVFKK